MPVALREPVWGATARISLYPIAEREEWLRRPPPSPVPRPGRNQPYTAEMFLEYMEANKHYYEP